MAQKNLERITPTIELIFDLCGGNGHNSQYLDFVYRGLHELSSSTKAIDKLYQYLNLDELLVFARDSWLIRARNSLDPYRVEPSFKSKINDKSIYEIIRETFKEEKFRFSDYFYKDDVITTGFRYFAKRKHVPNNLKEEHKELNPYKPNTLALRVKSFEEKEPDASKELKELLKRPVLTYVFERQYERAKQENGRDNYRISIVDKCPYNKRKKDFAHRILDFISSYPKEIIEEERFFANTSETGQLPLF